MKSCMKSTESMLPELRPSTIPLYGSSASANGPDNSCNPKSLLCQKTEWDGFVKVSASAVAKNFVAIETSPRFCPRSAEIEKAGVQAVQIHAQQRDRVV